MSAKLQRDAAGERERGKKGGGGGNGTARMEEGKIVSSANPCRTITQEEKQFEEEDEG